MHALLCVKACLSRLSADRRDKIIAKCTLQATVRNE